MGQILIMQMIATVHRCRTKCVTWAIQGIEFCCGVSSSFLISAACAVKGQVAGLGNRADPYPDCDAWTTGSNLVLFMEKSCNTSLLDVMKRLKGWCYLWRNHVMPVYWMQ